MFVLAAIVLASSPATANHGGGLGEVNPDQGTGGVTLLAYEWASSGTPDGAPVDGCHDSRHQLVVGDDFSREVTADYFVVDEPKQGEEFAFLFPAAAGRPSGQRLFSHTGRWFWAFCDGFMAMVPEGGPAVSVEDLVNRAVDRIDPPNPQLAVDPTTGKHAVQMLTWLAVEPDTWQELDGRAAAGRVLVTATLTPSAMIWDMGNGEPAFECDNPGVVRRRGMSDNRSTCDYTYRQPSINPPSNTWDLTGTIRYDVGYTTNAPGNYGPFTPVERTTIQTVQVVEIQAVGG